MNIIERINPPPSFSNGCMYHNNDTHLKKTFNKSNNWICY